MVTGSGEGDPSPGWDYFIGCDWGTSNMRVRLIRISDHAVVNERTSDQGAGRLAARLPSGAARMEGYESTLAEAIAQLAPSEVALDSRTPIVVSGMASASIGWKELPYAVTPFALDGSTAVVCRVPYAPQPDRAVFLVSGARCSTGALADAPGADMSFPAAGQNDIMRGEETELIGLLSRKELADLRDNCVVILPGTHSKHLHIAGNRMLRFRTYLTGELFELLCSHSILRHSVEPASAMVALEGDHDAGSFRLGVRLALESSILSTLFQVRTRQVLGGRTPREGSLFLSGLLIGTELAALSADLGLPRGNPVRLLLDAGPELLQRYRLACAELGLELLTPPATADSLPSAAAGQLQILRSLSRAHDFEVHR